MSDGGTSGVVREAAGGVYRVGLDGGAVVEATLRGRLKQGRDRGGLVVIGDRVVVQSAEGEGTTIERVLPRRTAVVRRGKGGHRAKTMAANLDRLMIVVAARDPSPRRELIDRLLVIGESGGLECVLILNKVDLGSADAVEELARIYRQVGYDVIETSAEDGRGLEELREVLCAGSSALVGPSGVGKSTLLNAIQPGLTLRTAAVSGRDGRGRHTTVSSRLVYLDCGGVVADTPGFSDAGLWGVDPGGLDRWFPELHTHADRCRFRGCTHLHEPECAVLEALGGGMIDAGRYASYETMRREAE